MDAKPSTHEPSPPAWAIHLCERPVKRGDRVNRLILGRPLSHVFLAMTTSTGSIASEIHAGAWAKGETRKLDYSASISEHGFALASLAHAATPLKKIFTLAGFNTDIQLAFHVTFGREQFKPESAVTCLIKDTPHNIGRLWEDMANKALSFNKKHVPYNRFGHDGELQNCQTSIVWLLDETGITIPPVKFSYATPGWRRIKNTKSEALTYQLRPGN